MTNTEILWLVVGLILGAGVGLLALCLVAMGKLGDDPLPQVDVHTDADGKLKHVMATDNVGVRMHRCQD